eukprot:7232692-Karenia_brevis.AAC.1
MGRLPKNVIGHVQGVESPADRLDDGQWQRVAPLLDDTGMSSNVISFSAAISAGEKGGQWQRVAPLMDDREGKSTN